MQQFMFAEGSVNLRGRRRRLREFLLLTSEAAEGGLVRLYCLKLTMFRTRPTDEFGYQFLATVPRVSLFWSGTGIVRFLRDITTLKWAIFSELEKAGNSA